jgi:hypothetical protein
MLGSKKRRREAARIESDHQTVLNHYRDMLAERDALIREYEERWRSPDGVKVLHDFQDALNMVREYQRVLHLSSMPDPVIERANKLLSSWGMRPYSDSNLGFKADPTTGEVAARPINSPPPKEESLEERLEREEEEWGEEAYGSGRVRIEAEAIDEGDEKEPGYTRARIRFVDASEESDDADAETTS